MAMAHDGHYLLVGRDETHYSVFHLFVILTKKTPLKLHRGSV